MVKVKILLVISYEHFPEVKENVNDLYNIIQFVNEEVVTHKN